MELMVKVSSLTQIVAERYVGADDPSVIDVVVHLRDGASLLGVHREHLVEQNKQPWGETLPHSRWFDRHASLPLDEFIVVRITVSGLLPGKAASQHAEEENAHRPHVAGRISIEALLVRCSANLGRSVGDAAADFWNVRACSQRHAEVDQPDGRSFFVGKNYVLRLDVSVDQLLAVHALDGLADLLEVSPHFALG